MGFLPAWAQLTREGGVKPKDLSPDVMAVGSLLTLSQPTREDEVKPRGLLPVAMAMMPRVQERQWRTPAWGESA